MYVDPSEMIKADLEENSARIEALFQNCHDIHFQRFLTGKQESVGMLAVYCYSLMQQIDDNPLQLALHALAEDHGMHAAELTNDEIIALLEKDAPARKLFTLLERYEQVVEEVLDGGFVVFMDRWDKAVCFDMSSVSRRQISEPITEAVINGPREGMVENLQQNLGLLRVRLRTPRFKAEFYTAGTHTKATVMIGYIDDRVNQAALQELRSRINDLNTTELLDTTAVRELVEDAVYSPFPQLRLTERPDVAVGSLLEGKIIIMAEGTGTILVCPITFTELFQSAEDYYQRTLISTMIRFLRIGAFFIALTLPSLYIALSNFHPEMIPSNLLLTILNSREGIPFPAITEALLMQFFFELLREAGIRLPRPIGAAVSIVGALIIGEASIRAGVASPIMTVVIALTGIASFSLPQYELAIALRILGIPLMILSFIWGGFGVMIGFIFIFLHLASLRSLGQPYLAPLGPLYPFQLMDVIVRAPLKLRKKLAGREEGHA